MGFEHTIKALAVCIQAKVPALLEGGVGEGKTAIISALFRRFSDDFETNIVALQEPPEYGGYPVPQPARVDDAGVVVEPAVAAKLPVRWVVRLGKAKRPGLFLDEFSNGAPAVRSATMRGVLDGTWGETHIPNLATVVAMNPPDIAESGYELSAPLSNRFCHLGWDMDVEYWNRQHIAGFPEPDGGGALPADWQKHMLWARTMVAAFANARGSAFCKMPEAVSERSKPFPTYRSWMMAETLLAACRALGYGIGTTPGQGSPQGVAPDDVVVKCVAGCVGHGAAIEFLAYASELDLPDPEVVLANPKALVLPERGDRAFAVLTAVVSAVLANKTVPRWNACWAVLAKATTENRPDIAASSARLLAAHRPPGANLPKEISAFVPLLKGAGLM